MLKVLFVCHNLAPFTYGGVEVQALKTMEYLNRIYGVRVDLIPGMIPKNVASITEYDIIHVFSPLHFPFEAYNVIKVAKRSNIPVIVSPILWPRGLLALDTYSLTITKRTNILTGILHRTMGLLRSQIIRLIWRTRKSFGLMIGHAYLARTLHEADLLLPNSRIEAKELRRYFGLDYSKMIVVPNGVDVRFYNAKPDTFIERFGIDNFVLYVGRIDIRKNVHALVYAFRKSKLYERTWLVMIGPRDDYSYLRYCLSLAGPARNKIMLLDPVPHESELLRSAYAACKVFALPSFYETPGLVALEAGLAGANIVITSEGSTREYFLDYAYYINPFDTNSIVRALIQAYESPKDNKLRNHILKNFTWERVVEKTFNAYLKLLESLT